MNERYKGKEKKKKIKWNKGSIKLLNEFFFLKRGNRIVKSNNMVKNDNNNNRISEMQQ